MKAWHCPLAVAEYPTTCPASLIPEAQLLVSTECAEIGHAYAIRAGDEGMMLPVVSQEYPYHLPCVVDPGSRARVSTECAEIGHAYAIRARDEGMVLPVVSLG